MRRQGKRLVTENGGEAEVNAGLAAMIAETFAIRNPLFSGCQHRGNDRIPRNRMFLFNRLSPTHEMRDVIAGLR